MQRYFSRSLVDSARNVSEAVATIHRLQMPYLVWRWKEICTRKRILSADDHALVIAGSS
jgi:hypothetical protein